MLEETVHFVRDTDTWIDFFSRLGEAMILDRRALKNRLKELGADFSHLTKQDHISLSKFQNAGSAEGVIKVWGIEFYNRYKSFCLHWAEEYETNVENRPLPKLKNIDKKNNKKPSESKISGMLHFFHFATAYASGDLRTKEYSKYLTDMDTNGQLWQQRGFDDVRTRILVDGKMIKLGSLPPGFAKDAWEFMNTWKK